MKIDPRDPAHHDRALWVVYGTEGFPEMLCCKLRAYTSTHDLLPAGTAGPEVCVWGYSVWRGKPGFRTLGQTIEGWTAGVQFAMPPEFYATQEAALARMRELTTSSTGVVSAPPDPHRPRNGASTGHEERVERALAVLALAELRGPGHYVLCPVDGCRKLATWRAPEKHPWLLYACDDHRDAGRWTPRRVDLTPDEAALWAVVEAAGRC